MCLLHVPNNVVSAGLLTHAYIDLKICKVNLTIVAKFSYGLTFITAFKYLYIPLLTKSDNLTFKRLTKN